MLGPSLSVSVPDQEVVPVASTHVVPSVLSSTLSMATLSAAVPLTLIDVDAIVEPCAGESIVTVGCSVSGAGEGAAGTSLDGGPSPAAVTAATR